MKKEIDLMNMYADSQDDYYDDSKILPKADDPKIMKRKNRSIRWISFFFLAVFIGLIAYLVYFQAVESTRFENSSYNRRRLDLLSEKYIRGSIYSADGQRLAYTDTEGAEEVRVYPYGRMFAHVVGYSANGGSGIEGACHSKLLSCHANALYRASTVLKNEKLTGDNVYVTLRTDLQESAYNALGSNRGAVVILDVKTGAVLAMVSQPDYDPNEILANWDYYTSDDDAVESLLLNRATQGVYPPGSTFKIFSALTYLRENNCQTDGYSYDCSGSIEHDGNVIRCYNSNRHGQLDLKQSFAKSCNSSFVNIGLSIKRSDLIDICESFHFNRKLDLLLPTSTSRFLLTEDTDSYELMQTVIGQGKTLVTPVQMAMTAAAIANDGKLMKPYFIDHVETFKGVTISKTFTKSYGKVMTDEEVSVMHDLMKEVVLSGTATSLSRGNYTAAGKTGSAEFGTQGDSHSWFVGYAPAENPEIAICVLVEGAGSGAEHAVPITGKILNDYYN